MPDKEKDKNEGAAVSTAAASESPAEEAKVEEAASESSGKTPGFDETIPGGKYKTADGRTVNANGEEIDEDGNVLKDKNE